jgi:GNAT superfamily N-acetyltransferase
MILSRSSQQGTNFKREDNQVISSNKHNKHARMDFRIRKYEAKDRKGVRDLCCDTGFLGSPIDPIFGDRDLFADIHTKYYLEKEPESVFIAEHRGSVVGYILGCKNSRGFQRYFILRILPVTLFKLVWRYFARYNWKERRYARWLLFRSLRETPRIPKDSAHLHIDLKEEYRSKDTGRRLIKEFFNYLRANKVRRVYGGVFSFEKRRKPDLFERVLQRIESKGTDFKIYDKKETTVWRDLIKGKVYLLRIVRDLD